MGFFEVELQKLFGNCSRIRDARFVGRACVGRLGETTNVKVQFVTLNTHEKYEALKATVFNRNEGVIDASAFRFGDVLGKKEVNSRYIKDIVPHVWTYDGTSEWYAYKPNAADYRALAAVVNSYLEVFLDLGYCAREMEKVAGRTDGYTSVLGAIEESKRKPRLPRQQAARSKTNDWPDL
ncbi:hypothetical protein FACS189490_03950 [Clostridia bacterium]|nr:hypothetical protein FACS189490_03950 [Clostridia bacterium]